MTKKQWLALLGIYVTYLFLGAVVFFYLEKDQESLQRDIDYKLYEKLIAVIRENQLNQSVILDLQSYCGRPLSENADLDTITPRLWDFYNSVFFVLTVVSTVGYGNIHPTMPLTRAIMMFYAMIGIPMNGILLTSLAQFFSTVFLRAHKKYKRYESRCGLAVDVLKYLVPGILFFIFVPATAFYYFEEWTYDESVYFAFVTLTTIGFGDIVAGQKQFKEFDSDLIMLYKSLILCWIIFGLGYLIMILGFITRAMRSKKMAQIEHKLVEAFTHSKIWHGFSKDIGYLRRVMNELYLDKFKPVFIDEYQHHHKLIFHRSKSLPNFAFSIDEENSLDPMNLYRRKRANSDFISRKKFSRVCSESDLRRIDRKATFSSTTKIQPDELIRHVVGVMGGFRDYEDDRRGVDVFSDDEILSSEAWHDTKNASIASINYPPTYEEAIAMRRKRLRALSECPPSSSGSAIQSSATLAEWTWSGAGANKMFQIVNERHKRSQLAKSKGKKLSSSIASGMKWLTPNRKRVKCHSECISESRKSVCSSAELTTIENGTNPDNLEGHYMTYTAGAGAQGIGLLHGKEGLSKPERSLIDLYMSGDHLFSGENRREALEEPSLTEFLLALSSLHSRLGNQRVEELRASERPSTGKTPRLADLFSSSETVRTSEKVQEPSNLKRLGRFLLRSYAKSEATGDSALPQNHLQVRRSMPGRSPNACYLEDNYHTVTGNPTIRIDEGEAGESSRSKYSFSLLEPPTSNGIMSNLSFRMRRGSTPVITAERRFDERSRIGLSSESVCTDPGHFPIARHPFSARWRQGESCSAKPSLSDVIEIVK